jgi:uncharacterized protein
VNPTQLLWKEQLVHNFTPIPSLLGGMLIGLASIIVLMAFGKVAGISGIAGGLLSPNIPDRRFRVTFLAGLVFGGLVLQFVDPTGFHSTFTPSTSRALVAGLVVGVGTQLGNGCTSGHGVCGVSRLAPRSMVATITFMATGLATIYIAKHVLGGF